MYPAIKVSDGQIIHPVLLIPVQHSFQSIDDSGDEFAVDNEDIFQQIHTLGQKLEESDIGSKNSSRRSRNKSDGDRATSNLSSGLPSARTLRGGQSVVARGRHTTYDRTMSSTTIGSTLPGSATPSVYSNNSFNNSLGGSGR